jgi:hypothetical protein
MRQSFILTGLLILAFAFNSCKKQDVSSGLNPKQFQTPTADFKVHTWWHWLDGAITKGRYYKRP